MGNKAKKGGSFEREICKKLSRWWTKNKRDDVFWRTAGSGARATTRMKKNLHTSNSAGDISSLDQSGKIFTETFLIELKRGYTNKISVLPFVDNLKKNKKTTLLSWWKKAEKEKAAHHKKLSLIIFKRDRKIPCIFFSKQAFNFCLRSFQQNRITHINILYGNQNFIILPLDVFFNIVNAKRLKKRMHKINGG